MNKKVIAISSCAALGLALMLGACGNNSAPAPSTDAPTEVSTVVDVTTNADGTTVAAPEVAADAAQKDGDVYADYMGQRFSAKDPWGGDAVIEVKLDDDSGSPELEFEDKLDVNVEFEAEAPLTGDTKMDFEWHDSEDDDGVAWEAVYSGTLEFKDGNIVLTYKDGALTTKSTEGDSDSHQVGALEDAAKTITFKK